MKTLDTNKIKKEKNILKTSIFLLFSFGVFFISLFLHASNIFAGDINDIINKETARRDQILKESAAQSGEFSAIKSVSLKQAQKYQDVVDDLKKQNIQNAPSLQMSIKSTPRAMVFVSFSMPALSLKKTIKDASSYQIPVVI